MEGAISLSLITATRCRASVLATNACPSILWQTDSDFQWVVVNDRADLETRSLLQSLRPPYQFTYLEMEHPTQGFGLCQARNLGLTAATGDWVAYLDNDNALESTFVKSIQSFSAHPSIRCSMVQQQRRRDVVGQGQILCQGKPFISPSSQAQSRDLVQQRELFDSNGFVHRRTDALLWNPDYRVFADYQFFLQCLELWGIESFRLYPAVLVQYVQRSDGIIGRSSYGDWAVELQQLLETTAFLTPEDKDVLGQLVSSWWDKHQRGRSLAGFC